MSEREANRRWNDNERVVAVKSYDILDTPPEPDFDDMVRLVVQICEAPRAGISLVDDHRQWFKAEIGLGFKEVPMNVSICPGITLRPGLTVIPDVTKDKRLASHPLVTGEPHIRFYAGVLLETSEGIPLGTLCVLDDEVRDLSEPQRFALVTIARQVMALLELRRALMQRDKAMVAQDRAEQGQVFLTRELHHRVKNTLAVVQAVAGTTGRTATNVGQFQTALSGRIGALAKAHAALTDDPSQSASLQNLLRMELGGYADMMGSRVSLEGPDVSLPSQIAVPLGLAVHELTSNSIKFGALSNVSGGIRVSWTTSTEDGSEVLLLDWLEHGGPIVRAPGRDGFGARMLGRVLGAQIGAKVTPDFNPEGFHVRIQFPIHGPHCRAQGLTDQQR